MGEAIEKLSGKLGVDTTDFKTGIAAANRELRLLESGFRASTASLGDWSKSATGMEERIKSLSAQIDVQKLKVAALRENYEKIRDEQGENSRAAKEAEIALNKQTETLGKMESELSDSEKALQELSAAEDEAGDSADETSGKLSNMGSVIDGIGGLVKGTVAVVTGLALAVGAVTVAIGGLVFSTASASAELVDLSAKTGISTTQLQELAYVGEQVGTSQETITGSLARLTRSMSGAQDQWADFSEAQAEAAAEGEEFDGQLGDTAAAFERLGISVTDSSGQLRDRQDVFNEIITALANVSNEAERDALAMEIFGKSAMELNPLIKAGAEEMNRLAQEAHEVGAVMSEEDVAAFEAFDDTLASLKAGLQGTLGTLASAFLPGFQAVFDQAGGYLREFASIVKTSDGDFGALADGLGGLLSKIIGDVASQAPQMLQAGLGILQSVIDSIVTNLPTLIDAAIGIIMMLLDFIIQNLPTLIEAGLQILIALVQGITQALPTLIPAIVQALLTIVQTLVDNLPLIIDAALQLILALVQGLLLALPILLAAAPEIIASLVTAMLEMLPMIGSAALQLLIALATGIVLNIPVLLVAVGELIVAVGKAIYDFILDTPNRGREIIQGLADGVRNSAGMLYEAVSNVIKGMIERIKSLLNMKSPSGVGKDIGSNLFGSIGLGGEEEAPKVRRMLTRQMVGLANDLSAVSAPTIGATGLGGVGSGSSISIGDIIINIPGTSATPQQVAVAVQDGVLKALRAKGGM